VLALCAVHIDAQVWGYVSQSFSLIRSDTLESAEYVMVNNITARDGVSYEERYYPASKWACTARTVPKTESSPTRSMFMDLFRYFAGDNSEKKEIDLTVPVSTYVQQRENDVTFYETCLTLPAKSRSEPAKPNNPSVFIDDKPERVVLTRRVGGYFVTDIAWEEEAISLKKLLKEKETDANFGAYYRNGYDAPTRPFNRRNEVWYVKEGEAATQSVEKAKKMMAEEAEKKAEEAKKKAEEVAKKEAEKAAIEAEKQKKKADKKKASEEKKAGAPAAAAAAEPAKAEEVKKVEVAADEVKIEDSTALPENRE